MSALHTPGPWSRDTGGGLKGDVRGANGRWVALCWGIGNGNNNKPEYKAECDANACLIAAAPDLLEALREVLKHEKWHAAVADEVTPEARMAIKKADAAIAKATGGAA